MTDETMSATCAVNAPAETVFAVLADPRTHQAIDGTGWVRESLDGKQLTAAGQVFRMAMYHDNYGGMHYEMANRVEVFEPPRAIAWLPGQGDDDADLDFGGWVWRYDLEPLEDDRTNVTLTYDWSAVPQAIRDNIAFPPFDRQHLDNSLKYLAGLAQERT
ncbi:SRPBCC family protein [Mycolicibacterium neworleansense]|uniref:Polyketide cyclase/dehydrase and lipid transport n=1 Tax=Mycolicibacterium neworleansense TaxID=146018 RepID=A0A0H5RQ47_9MYCO|nr:SRPBCC family protein [Mycolicibacterium neworleansense]MCV7365133.1 SRPBCC family protein [Mycolicibacterium neworleansense]CRZ15936.1 polyketide cyclase/dehydrase and lipid transport [Mycolicibacterium neworleansense]